MRLSYSSINTYETCPAKYRFQYEERLPSAPSPALSFGDSLHQALYRFHSRPVPVAPPLEELLEMLDAVWVADGYVNVSEEQAYLEHGRQVLELYHRDNAARYAIPAAMEFRFQIEVEGVQVSGVIDRMDRIPGGGYEIVDYKTNRRLPPQHRVDEDLQLSVYYLAARQIWGIEPERLTLYYLLPGQRMSTVRSPADADVLRRRIATVAERIEMIREAVDEATEERARVEVDTFQGLLVDYCAKKNARIVLRGLRAVADFEYELQMANMNRHLDTRVETVFLMANDAYFYVSSNLVKEAATLGGNVDRLVPASVARRLYTKLGR